MAGRARLQKVRKALLNEAARELGEDATALDYVVYRVENGTTLTDLASEVTALFDMKVLPSFVREAAAYGHDPATVTERLTSARARGASAIVDEAKQLIDSVPKDRDAIAKVKEQANIRTFIASRWNRQEWGEQKGPSVNVSIGSLHIDALRSRKAAARMITDVAEVLAIEGSSEPVDSGGDSLTEHHEDDGE